MHSPYLMTYLCDVWLMIIRRHPLLCDECYAHRMDNIAVAEFVMFAKNMCYFVGLIVANYFNFDRNTTMSISVCVSLMQNNELNFMHEYTAWCVRNPVKDKWSSHNFLINWTLNCHFCVGSFVRSFVSFIYLLKCLFIAVYVVFSFVSPLFQLSDTLEERKTVYCVNNLKHIFACVYQLLV